MSLLKNLSKDTLIYGVGTIIQKIIGIMLLPFYTRALLPAEYGVLDTLSTFVFFISTIFGLGIAGATSRYFFIADTDEEKKKLLYTSSRIRIISYSIPLILLVIFSNQTSLLLFDTDQYRLVIIAAAFLLYFSSQQEIQSQIFRFYREPMKFSFVTILKTIINPVSGILLVVVLQWGVLGATLASLITSLITFVFAYFYYVRKKYIRQFSWYWAKKMLYFGIPLIFTGILTWINSVSDRFFLLHYQNLEQIGLYSIGNVFSQPILLVNLALSMGALIFVMSLFTEEKDPDKPKTKELLTKIWHIYLSAAVSIGVLISVFSYSIVHFVTTPDYIGGILAIPFLMFGHILYMSADLTGNGMTLKEQSKPYFWIMLCAAVTNVVLNFYFVPNFGYVGAAITTVISNIVYFIVAYFWSQKVFYIKRSFIKPAILFLIGLSVAVFFPFYEFYTKANLSLFIKVPVLIVVFSLPFLLKLFDYRSLKNLFYHTSNG